MGTPLWGNDGLLWVATQLDGGTRALRLERIDDTVYASVGGSGSILIGVDVTSGEVLWRERGFQKVNFVCARDRSLLLDANGHLALAKLSREGIQIDSEVRITEGPTWTAPTLAGSTLYVRDKESVRAFDLGPEVASR